jgi:hypothetical protein
MPAYQQYSAPEQNMIAKKKFQIVQATFPTASIPSF